MPRAVRRFRLPASPSLVLQHLKVLRPPDYTDLVPLASRDVDEGSIICVDVLADSPAVVRFIDEHISRSHLAQICRYCPCVLLAPSDDVRDVIRAFHSRPLLRGFRAVLVPATPWGEILREVLTEERSLAQDLATWILFQRRHHRLDREILEAIFSLPRDVSLVKGLELIASDDTVAKHLRHLRLPPASRLKTLGLAVRACLRLQRDPHATIESVAASLRYASGAGVSLLISRTFDATTRELREKLGWEWLIARWEAELGR